MDKKPKRGRPKNGHRVHSIRCSDAAQAALIGKIGIVPLPETV